MDVGNPSNFERLEQIFQGSWKGMADRVEGRSVTDSRTMETMKKVHTEYGRVVDPHTAVGIAAALDHLSSGPSGRRGSGLAQGDRALHGASGQVLRHRGEGHGPASGNARKAVAMPQPAQAGRAHRDESARALRIPAGSLRLSRRAGRRQLVVPAPLRSVLPTLLPAHAGALPALLLNDERVPPVLLPRLVDPARLVVALLVRVAGGRIRPVQLQQQRE